MKYIIMTGLMALAFGQFQISSALAAGSGTESSGGSSAAEEKKGEERAEKREEMRKKMREKKKKSCDESCSEGASCCSGKQGSGTEKQGSETKNE